jgi:hypothetical protein
VEQGRVDRDEFRRRFHEALEAAAEDAASRLGRPVSRQFRVLLHGAGHAGDIVAPEIALDALYLGPDRSYRIIDFGVVEVGNDFTTVFVRASAHRPMSYDQTWNVPPGSGPFKQLGTALNVRVTRE